MAFWQTYFADFQHFQSFHVPAFAPWKVMQSSMPELLGSSAFQLVYDSGVLDGLHTHAPSDAASADVIQLSRSNSIRSNDVE